MIENKDYFKKKTNKYTDINPPVSPFNKGGGSQKNKTIQEEEVYRFAPSPSGYLHVGGARTAIFNWLLARKGNGKFLIRIEDTDKKRSSDESVQNILNSLQWLGLQWDEEPVYQSSRKNRHLQVVSELLKNGHAYYCFCDKRDENEADPCRNFSSSEVEKKLSEKLIYTVRIKIPDGDIIFHDGVIGEVRVNRSELSDFIILRSDKTPVYHIAVVVDDHDMKISHVIRGADHLSNTAKQIIIYKSLGWAIPEFSHIPLILSEDKSRLSKRHGAVSVGEFRKSGIIPEALFNFLCLLGWSPGDDQEIISKDHLIQIFSLDRVSKHNAIFDRQKLLWMNGKYISSFDDITLLNILKIWLSNEQMKLIEDDKESFLHLIRLLKERSKTIAEMVDSIKYYFTDPVDYDEKGVKKYFSSLAAELLEKIKEEWMDGLVFHADKLENLLREFAEKENINAAKIIHPLRLALTGKTFSPGIFEIMEILGKEKVLRRVDRAIQYMRKLK